MSIGLFRGTVSVEPHSKEWETTAQQTIGQLKNILRASAVDIQHIGSTSIVSICAKPIIDIVIGVNNFNEILALNDKLEEKGFLFRGQDHPEQYLYVCGRDNFITHHIHVVLYDSDYWNDYVNMRDYLNSHSDDAKAYSELKMSLAEKYAEDRITYTNMKGDFIGEILAKARKWRIGK